MNRQKLAWWLWACGTVLIVLSWFGIVSYTVGWIGFAIGIVGSVIGWGLVPPQNQSPSMAQEADATNDEQPN